MSVDIHQSPFFDLTSREVQQTLIGCMQSGLILGVWIAFPCTTFSIARRPALRSREFLTGLPSLRDDKKAQKAILAGNRTLSAALRFAKVCGRLKIPTIFENPQSSLAWQDRRWKPLAERYPVSDAIIL